MRVCPSLLRTFRTRTILNAPFAAQNYFTYKQAINKEVANISRIQQKQHQIVASLNAVLTGVCVAVFSKASQSLFPADGAASQAQ